MYHCLKFKAQKTFILFNDTEYINRYIKLGVCPRCKKLIATMYATELVSNLTITKTFTNSKAKIFLSKIRHQVDYVLTPQKKNKELYGFIYGENKEVKIGKEKYIRQYSVDFSGTRKLIKEIKI